MQQQGCKKCDPEPEFAAAHEKIRAKSGQERVNDNGNFGKRKISTEQRGRHDNRPGADLPAWRAGGE